MIEIKEDGYVDLDIDLTVDGISTIYEGRNITAKEMVAIMSEDINDFQRAINLVNAVWPNLKSDDLPIATVMKLASHAGSIIKDSIENANKKK